MPKVPAHYLEARKNEILEAALSCFARRGFHQTTMQDICREGQVSPGALYRYFRSKEEIIQAMSGEELRRNLAVIEVMKGRGDTQQILDELAGVFFGHLEDIAPEICNVHVELCAEALRNPRIREIYRRILDSYRQAFAELTRQAQSRGDINPALDPEAVARTLMSLFEGLLLQKSIEPDIDLWSYVAVVRALIGGSFWQRGHGRGEALPEESEPSPASPMPAERGG